MCGFSPKSEWHITDRKIINEKNFAAFNFDGLLKQI